MHIKVRVKTGAKNEEVRKVSEDLFDISVREKPEQNMANDRVVALVARGLEVPASRVRIVRGHYRTSKTLQIGYE